MVKLEQSCVITIKRCLANTHPKSANIFFYEGLAGIALTYAYAGEVLRSARFKKSAQRLYDQIIKTIALADRGYFSSASCGMSEVGGLIYSLSHYYRLSKKKKILTALQTLLAILPELIKKDRYFDVMSGVAGCLAVLTAVKPLLPQEFRIKELQTRCVNHLLKYYSDPQRVPSFEMALMTNKPLLGFSHGVIGIAWALQTFAARLHRPKITAWIKKAQRYENKVYRAHQNRWPDWRSRTPRYAASWCHGTVGIGLAKLDCYQHYPQSVLLKHLQQASAFTQRHGFRRQLDLCHGASGSLGLLQEMQLAGILKEDEAARWVKKIVLQFAKKSVRF